MKQLYLDIESQIKSQVTEVQFIHVYNSQFDLMENQESYSFPFPCVFIEFVAQNEIQQLGGGYQIFDPLMINVHIGHNLYDAGDGTMEQNLDIFDLRTKIFKALNKFEPNGAVQFIRVSETQDTNHKSVYHFIQTYKTNYIDNSRSEPVNGVTTTPPTDLELDVNYNPSPYLKSN